MNTHTDTEKLTALLAAGRVRGARKHAKQIIDHFGSFADAVGRVTTTDGFHQDAVAYISVVRDAATELLHGKIKHREVLTSWHAVLDYCRAACAFKAREEFHLLFLDKRNHLIADELHQWGTVDHTPVYPREVLKRALELNASAIIMVHNHPSGDPTPSRADIQMTQAIIECGKPLGITVHDHVIIGTDGHASLKALKLI